MMNSNTKKIEIHKLTNLRVSNALVYLTRLVWIVWHANRVQLAVLHMAKMPFCDFMAFSHSDFVLRLGLVPDIIYSLLAVLLHTERYVCDRWCDGPRY